MPAYTAYDLGGASVCAVVLHGDRSRTGSGDEVLKSAGEPGAHHLLGRQQRWDREQDDAAPSRAVVLRGQVARAVRPCGARR